ncbi:FAD:protein FMN transferase [Streptomyces sp. NPDC056983]|uniref:FAD:protein FMN transferase n=1 Tax=Streptomyces sp. NPDC056983 TaxID=3345987 RepID=UPI00363600CA
MRIGLEHPSDPRQVIGVARLHNQTLCAPAVNRRAWGRDLHHVLDARTGHPVRTTVATWAVADNAATADALATALFFAPYEQLAEGFAFESVSVHADRQVRTSPGLDADLFA